MSDPVVPLAAEAGFTGAPSSPHTVRVWDLPTRIFHWALAVCCVGLVVTGLRGGDAMVWHGRLGMTVGALLLFRLVWGWVGGYWSRFAQFAFGPRAIGHYLRQGEQGAAPALGHSPLGSLSVWAMLATLLAQVLTGLVANDDIAYTGPLYAWVSEQVSVWGTRWHSAVGKRLLIVLVLLHVGALLYYRRKGRHLVPAMLHGNRETPERAPASADGWRERLRALLILACCGAAMFGLNAIAT